MGDGAGPSEGGASDGVVDATLDSTAEGRGTNDATGDGPVTDIAAAQGDFDGNEPTRDAPECTGDLSGIGTSDFAVSFTMESVQDGLVALANQRSSCGPSMLWDVRISDGFILAEVDDGALYTKLVFTGAQVNDGRSHDISVRRTAQTLTTYVDGIASGPMTAPQSLGRLAPLATGVDVCVGVDMTTPLVGALTNLCITRP
jgi:hypothetical protein